MTETAPDLLDYTEQAQALVMELQRLSSMRAALDDAAASMRNGQTEIQTATSTLSEHAALALSTYDDAQKHGDSALAAAQVRMEAAADLAENVASVLSDLQQLQGAAQTLSSSREILAGATTMLAAKGHSLDAGADAIVSSSQQLESVRLVFNTTHDELRGASSDLTAAASGVATATATLSEQAAHAQLGIETLGRCEEALASATTELATARESLKQARTQFDVDSTTLIAGATTLHAQTALVENTNQSLGITTQHLINVTETLESAQRTLNQFTINAQEQANLIRTMMEQLVEDQSHIGMMVATLEHRQEQENSAIATLTSVHQRHSRELTASLEQVQQRLFELHPVIERLTVASEDQSLRIDSQQRRLEHISAITLWSGIGIAVSILLVLALRWIRII